MEGRRGDPKDPEVKLASVKAEMDRVKPEDRAFYKNFNERAFNTSIPIYRSRVCTMRLEGLAAYPTWR